MSLVKSKHQNATLRDLLRKDVTALLGISNEMAQSLKLLDIITILDLGNSDVFAAATRVLDASTNTRSLLYQHGAPTADLVRETLSAGTKVEQLKDLKIEALQRVPEANAGTISKFLGWVTYASSLWYVSLGPVLPISLCSRAINKYFESIVSPEDVLQLTAHPDRNTDTKLLNSILPTKQHSGS